MSSSRDQRAVIKELKQEKAELLARAEQEKAELLARAEQAEARAKQAEARLDETKDIEAEVIEAKKQADALQAAISANRVDPKVLNEGLSMMADEHQTLQDEAKRYSDAIRAHYSVQMELEARAHQAEKQVQELKAKLTDYEKYVAEKTDQHDADGVALRELKKEIAKLSSEVKEDPVPEVKKVKTAEELEAERLAAEKHQKEVIRRRLNRQGHKVSCDRAYEALKEWLVYGAEVFIKRQFIKKCEELNRSLFPPVSPKEMDKLLENLIKATEIVLCTGVCRWRKGENDRLHFSKTYASAAFLKRYPRFTDVSPLHVDVYNAIEKMLVEKGREWTIQTDVRRAARAIAETWNKGLPGGEVMPEVQMSHLVEELKKRHRGFEYRYVHDRSLVRMRILPLVTFVSRPPVPMVDENRPVENELVAVHQ